jgi:hypothetical protein
MRQKVGWTERDAEGVQWNVEASRNRNEWTFVRRAHRRDDWEALDPPSVADWEHLLGVLERKYQRRRCAWRDVEQVRERLNLAKTREHRP